MYLRERFLKCLKVKNVLLVIAGVLCLIFGLVILADLVSYYIDDLATVAKAKATPDAVKALALGAVLILIATISRKLMGDARFYSSYFEGSLEGRITYKELAQASGKPVFGVAIELIWTAYSPWVNFRSLFPVWASIWHLSRDIRSMR